MVNLPPAVTAFPHRLHAARQAEIAIQALWQFDPPGV
jgi:hypothetical protein